MIQNFKKQKQKSKDSIHNEINKSKITNHTHTHTFQVNKIIRIETRYYYFDFAVFLHFFLK